MSRSRSRSRAVDDEAPLSGGSGGELGVRRWRLRGGSDAEKAC